MSRYVGGERLDEARERIELFGYRQMDGVPGVGSQVVWFDHDRKTLRQVVLKDLRDDGRWEIETTEAVSDELMGESPAGVRYYAKVVDLYTGPPPAEPQDVEEPCCNCGWPIDEHTAGKGKRGCDKWLEPTLANRLYVLSRNFTNETRELILEGSYAANLTGYGESPRRNVVLGHAIRLIEQATAMDAVERSEWSGTKHIRVVRCRGSYGYTVMLEAVDLVLDLGVLLDVQWSMAKELGDFLEGFIDRLPGKPRPPETKWPKSSMRERAERLVEQARAGTVESAVDYTENVLMKVSGLGDAKALQREVFELMIRREPDVELEVCEGCGEQVSYDREAQAAFPALKHKANCRVAHLFKGWGFEIEHIECHKHDWDEGVLCGLICANCGAEAESCDDCDNGPPASPWVALDGDGESVDSICVMCEGTGVLLDRSLT